MAKKVSAKWFESWYVGAIIQSPDNALRDEGIESGGFWVENCAKELHALIAETGVKEAYCADFMRMVKSKGFHSKYYSFKKYENDCNICKNMGLSDKI